MPYFVDSDREKISLPGGDEWIEIKAKLSFAERNRLTDAFFSITMKSEDVDAQAHLGEYTTELMRICITDWYLLGKPDADGRRSPIRFKPALIEQFDIDDPLIDIVLQEVARRNPLTRRAARVVPGVSN